MADPYTVNKINKENINPKMKEEKERTDLIRGIPNQLKRKNGK